MTRFIRETAGDSENYRLCGRFAVKYSLFSFSHALINNGILAEVFVRHSFNSMIRHHRLVSCARFPASVPKISNQQVSSPDFLVATNKTR